MKVKDQGEWILLNVVVEKYRETLTNIKVKGKPLKDPEGNNIKEKREIFVKDVLVPTSFLKSGISLAGETLSARYKNYKNKSIIYDTYTQRTYVVQHKAQDVMQGLMNKPIVGFQVGKTN